MTLPDNTVPPWAGEPYSIKRHGCSISNCDSEPIQTPGCIQSHGALLVLRPGDLAIRQASENSLQWLGHEPDALIGNSVSSVLGEAHASRLREVLATQPVERNAIFIFTWQPADHRDPLDVFVHTIDNTIILEFEAAAASGTVHPDYYSLVKQTVSQLRVAESLSAFCDAATLEIRNLTGLDRVMIYRFHPDDHGEVIAESKRADLPSWVGLHYPAEDIPKPARDIFSRIWVRPLPDAQAPPVELVPLVDPDTGRPTDLTYAALRGASVMYTEYLRNMKVAASLTLPIRPDGRLWGLIACHHYTARPFPYQIRTACELLAQVISLLISSVKQRAHLSYRLQIQSIHAQLLALASGEAGLSALTGGTPSLVDGIDCGGAALYHSGQWFLAGKTPDEAQLRVLADWLVDRPEFRSAMHPVYVTDSLRRDYPGGADLAVTASGVLAILVAHSPKIVLLWFRPETIQTIQWGGNPHDKPAVIGPHGPRLTPRASFELFLESVKGTSLPWQEFEVDLALDLRRSILQIIVSRAEQFAALNTELLRSNEELNTFAYVASHDLKEPLRGIFKYAHLLRENSERLDEEQRQRLDGMIRLTQRMDNLLDSLLHFSRVGQAQFAYERSNLSEVVDEALEMLCARRDDVGADIVIPRGLPEVTCDRVKVREVFCNLIDNALKYNDKSAPRIEIGYLAPDETRALSSVPENCQGQLVFYVRDNGIGIQPRHRDQVFKMFKRLHGREEYGGGTGAGLCIARMLVERHRGQLWFDSEPGSGSTFFFTLSKNAPDLVPPIGSPPSPDPSP